MSSKSIRIRSARSHLYSAALISAIFSAIGWVAFIMGNMGLPALSEISDPLLFFQTIQDTKSVWLMYGWGGIFGTLFSVPFIVAFYHSMKDSEPMALVSTVFALMGAVLTSFGFMKPLTVIYQYVPIGLEASSEALPAIKTAAVVALEVFEVPWALGSFLLFGLGFGLLAYYALRTSTGPKRVNLVGIVAGLTGIVWLTPYISVLESIAVILRIVNILTIMIWSIGLSFALSKKH